MASDKVALHGMGMHCGLEASVAIFELAPMSARTNPKYTVNRVFATLTLLIDRFIRRVRNEMTMNKTGIISLTLTLLHTKIIFGGDWAIDEKLSNTRGMSPNSK